MAASDRWAGDTCVMSVLGGEGVWQESPLNCVGR